MHDNYIEKNYVYIDNKKRLSLWNNSVIRGFW